MSQPKYQGEPKPWKNIIRRPEPLPIDPDTFPWRAGELILAASEYTSPVPHSATDFRGQKRHAWIEKL
jgi:hypothetical protein